MYFPPAFGNAVMYSLYVHIAVLRELAEVHEKTLIPPRA